MTNPANAKIIGSADILNNYIATVQRKIYPESFVDITRAAEAPEKKDA